MTSPSTSSPTSSVSKSGKTYIDALLSGVKWGTAGPGTSVSLSYSFPWADSANATFSGPNGTAYSLKDEPTASEHFGLNATQQSAATLALQAWANVANISFKHEVDSSVAVGDIRFAFSSASSLANAWGYAGYPSFYYSKGGDIWINASNAPVSTSISDSFNSWAVGSNNYSSLMHEVGHTLGLKHPFEDGVVLDKAEDNRMYSIMSYTNPPNNKYLLLFVSEDGSEGFSYDVVRPISPMVYDIAAIQYVYGANYSYNSGNDVYSFDPKTPFYQTIWDGGGNDTISVSNFSDGCDINLTPGSYSIVYIRSDSVAGTNLENFAPVPTYDGTSNLGIAYNCFIENVIGGSGNDKLTGNSVNNNLNGGAGTDTAVWAHASGNFRLNQSDRVWTVTDQTGADGTDTLTNIERLQFADKKMALDLLPTEHGGQALEFIGALAANLVTTPSTVGVILGFFDQGYSLTSLSQYAIDIGLTRDLAGSSSNADLARLVYRNVVGAEADADKTDMLLSFMDGRNASYSQAQFLATVAELDLNQQHINLIGLQQTGIEYI